MSRDPLRVVLIGVGGVGGLLAKGLAATLNYSAPGSGLVLIDGDVYEDKNKERQFFRSYGNKAEVQASELTPQFPDVYIVPVPRWVVGEITKEEAETQLLAREFFSEGDVIFATVDNHAARKLCFETAKNFDNIDVFTGGNDDAYFGSTYHYRRRNGEDVTDDPFFYHPEMANPTEKNPGEMSCQERAEQESGTQLLATNMGVAAFLLAKFHHTVINDGNPVDNEVFIELADGKAAAHQRVPDKVTVLN